MTPSPETARRSLSPTWPGGVTLATAGFAVLVWLVSEVVDDGSEPLLVVSFALIVVVVADAVSAWRASPPALSAGALGDGTAGQPVHYRLDVPWLRRPVTVALLGPPYGVPVGHARMTSSTPAMAAFAALPRGVYPHQTFDVHARGPLGLASVQRRHRVPSPLVVGPAPVAHPLGWPPPPASLVDEDLLRAPGEELFRGVRDYVRGDARRAVHWRATAHHGTLMVREHEATGLKTVRIVVAYLVPGPQGEAAVGRAAWAVEDACRRGWRVRLTTCEPAHPPPPDPPLRRSTGFLVAGRSDRHVQTVDEDVADRRELTRRLALAAPGWPAPPPSSGRSVTRWISPEGDAWL